MALLCLSVPAGYCPGGNDQRLHNRGMQARIPGQQQIPQRDEGKRISLFMFPGPMKRGHAMLYFYVGQHSTLFLSPGTPPQAVWFIPNVYFMKFSYLLTRHLTDRVTLLGVW
jgi:hypothetical protein